MTGIVNSLRDIYTRADRVVYLDGLLLRLHSRSMIDLAVNLCLSRWIRRLWPFTETKQVLLKTFDLDAILQFLYQIDTNKDHRYFPILTRLAPLRPSPPGYRY